MKKMFDLEQDSGSFKNAQIWDFHGFSRIFSNSQILNKIWFETLILNVYKIDSSKIVIDGLIWVLIFKNHHRDLICLRFIIGFGGFHVFDPFLAILVEDSSHYFGFCIMFFGRLFYQILLHRRLPLLRNLIHMHPICKPLRRIALNTLFQNLLMLLLNLWDILRRLHQLTYIIIMGHFITFRGLEPIDVGPKCLICGQNRSFFGRVEIF